MPLKMLKPVLPAVMLPFLAMSAYGQAAMGTSHPESNTDTANPAEHYAKPTHEAPATATTPAYQDSFPATASDPRLLTHEPGDVAASAAKPSPAVVAEGLPARSYAPQTTGPTAELEPEPGVRNAADADIVLSEPTRPTELHRGTLLHARLREQVSTQRTVEGAVFTAELLQNVGHSGVVLLPAGSLIRGRVSAIHGGSRISGGASVHLRPETVSLPDGTLYRLEARVTDVDGTQDLKVNDEGTVVLHSHPKAAAAVVAGVTGTAALTGALVGGGVGAAVGAIAGAGVGTAVYLKRDVQETMPVGTNLIFALEEPLQVSPR